MMTKSRCLRSSMSIRPRQCPDWCDLTKTRENRYNLSFEALIFGFLVFYRTDTEWIIVSIVRTSNTMNFYIWRVAHIIRILNNFDATVRHRPYETLPHLRSHLILIGNLSFNLSIFETAGFLLMLKRFLIKIRQFQK